MDTECRHSGVFVHEAVSDPAIGALVSIHSVNLQNKRPRWLVLQDRRALSVLLTLRRVKTAGTEVGGREDHSNVSMEKLRSALYSIETGIKRM